MEPYRRTKVEDLDNVKGTGMASICGVSREDFNQLISDYPDLDGEAINDSTIIRILLNLARRVKVLTEEVATLKTKRRKGSP